MSRSMPSALSAELRRRRLRARQTQAEAAEELGVTQQTVARWESGSATPRGHSAELAAYLRVSPDEVFELSQKPGLSIADAGASVDETLPRATFDAVLARVATGEPLTSDEVAFFRELLGLVGFTHIQMDAFQLSDEA